jgi:hypothetical protein
MLVFHFIFDLLWRGEGFLSNFCSFLGFRELKQIEMHGLDHTMQKGVCAVISFYLHTFLIYITHSYSILSLCMYILNVCVTHLSHIMY